jgi:transcriptional regulator with PAS, ATPase and Fis domain
MSSISPGERKWLVASLGASVLIYSAFVLAYVGTAPDVRIRAMLADSDLGSDISGVVIRDVVDLEIPGDVAEWRPQPGDVLRQLGDKPIRTFLDYVYAIHDLRNARIGPEGTLSAGTDPKDFNEGILPPLIEIAGNPELNIDTAQYVETHIYRPEQDRVIHTWVKLQSLPLTEVLLSFIWLLLQSGIFAVSGLSAWHRAFDRSARLFFLMCGVTMVAFMGAFHWWILAGNMFLNLPFLVCALFLPSVTLHFFLSYPRQLPPMDGYPKQTIAVIYSVPGVAAVVMLSLLLCGWWFTADEMSSDSIQIVMRCLATLRETIYVYLAFAAICFFVMLIALAAEYLSTSSHHEQNQMKWIFRAGVISAIPISYTLYLALFHRVEFALGAARIPMFLASLLFMAAYTVGILRYKLMLVEEFVSRGVSYHVASLSLTLGYGISVALVAFLANDLIAVWAGTGQLQKMLSVGVILTFSVVFLSWSRGRIQQTIDRRFYREKYQLDKALQRVNRSLDSLDDRHTLGQRMLASCRDVLGAEVGALFMREPGSDFFALIAMDGNGNMPQRIEADPEMLEILQKEVAILRVGGSSSETTFRTLRELACELMFSLETDGNVEGIVALARRINGSPYTAEDLTFINTLGQFTTVALRSVKIHQDFARVNDELRIKANKIDEQRRQIAMMQSELTTGVVRTEPENVKKNDPTELRREMIKGNSPAIQRVLETVRKVSASESTVLVRGASGTGKELLAQAIHQNNSRRDGPLVRVHCAALSPSLLESELFGHVKGAFTGAHKDRIGRFEAAHGGTLFLDEIGDISQETQIKLLRVLQTRSFEPVGGTRTIEVDVRLITATHQDLQQLIKEGRFREDLYYRLNVVSITLPTLDERKEDIFELSLYFLKKASQQANKLVTRIDDDAMELLRQYSWPGNIRELENVIERAVVLCDAEEIGVRELPVEIIQQDVRPVSKPLALEHVSTEKVIESPAAGVIESVRERSAPVPEHETERALLTRVLGECDGNKSRAAREMGIPRSTFFSRLKKAGLL